MLSAEGKREVDCNVEKLAYYCMCISGVEAE